MPDKIPLSGREYAALQSLFAAVSNMSVLYPILEKRAKLVPDLWRDMRLVQAKTDTMLERILRTVPLNKLRQINEELAHVQLYVKVEAPGIRTRKSEGFSYTPTAVLNDLLNYVCEHECLCCDKTAKESRKCEIRRMIEDALPHEVGHPDGEHCKFSDMVLGIAKEEGA